MTSTSSAHITCLCGAISEPGTLLRAPELPIYKETCHCGSCRRATGLLSASFPPLKSSPSQDALSKLTPYLSSPGLTRYFCSTCGTKCFAHNRRSERWSCLAGTIEQTPSSKAENVPWPKDTVKVWYHDYVADTLDGGLVPLQLNLNGRSLATWAVEGPEPPPEDGSFDLSHETILSLPSKAQSTLPQATEGSFLPVKCHCGGVSLLIKRADFKDISSSEVGERFIQPGRTKYLSYLCACRSCRLALGGSLVPWALTRRDTVFLAPALATIDNDNSLSLGDIDTATLRPLTVGRAASELKANPGQTLKQYWSSADVCWSFCGRCGASVSYWNQQRPEELDVAVGVLRSKDGCMARSWLEWDWGRCSFPDECVDGETLTAWLRSPEVMKKIGG